MYLVRQAIQYGSKSVKQQTRNISYQIDKPDMQAILKARKRSPLLGKMMKRVENAEKIKRLLDLGKLMTRATNLSKRATGPDGYLHSDFTQRNLFNVMKRNYLQKAKDKELKVTKSPGRNAYNQVTRTIELVDFRRGDMFGHEFRHAYDHVRYKGRFNKMSVFRKELSAFRMQKRIAKQLGVTPNMPFPNSARKSARTYLKKNPERFKE